jgi:hypothetical protein
MDKHMLTGRKLGCVFNSKCGYAYLSRAIILITKTARLKVENLAKTTFRLSPIIHHALELNLTINSQNLLNQFLSNDLHILSFIVQLFRLRKRNFIKRQ